MKTASIFHFRRKSKNENGVTVTELFLPPRMTQHTT